MSTVPVSVRLLHSIADILASGSDSDPFEEAQRKFSIWHRAYTGTSFMAIALTDALVPAEVDYYGESTSRQAGCRTKSGR